MRRNSKKKAVFAWGTASFLGNGSFLGWLVLFAGLSFPGGCATNEQVYKVEERLRKLESRQAEADVTGNRLDSLIRDSSVDKSNQYARLNNKIDNMAGQIEQLTTMIAELESRLSQVSSSPTAQIPSGQGADNASADAQSSGIDCIALYDDSFIMVRQADYEGALAGFKDYLNYCGHTENVDNAQYWIAHSLFAQNKIEDAAKEFNALISNHPKSEKLATAYYYLGRCSEKSGDVEQAKKYYQTAADKYPQTPEGQLAADKLAELKR